MKFTWPMKWLHFIVCSGIVLPVSLGGCFSNSIPVASSTEPKMTHSLQTPSSVLQQTNSQIQDPQLQISSMIQSDINSVLNRSSSSRITSEDFAFLKEQNLLTVEDAQALSVFLEP